MSKKGQNSAPAVPGTALLGVSDYAGWKSGQITLSEVAAKCGVSIAAVSKRFKKLAAIAAKGDPDGDVPANAITLESSQKWVETDPSKPLPSFSDADARRLAISCAFSTLVHANHFLTSNTEVSPSVLKASGVATGDAIDLLVKLGALALPEPAEKPLPRLIIRTMTDAEEHELREGGVKGEDGDE